MCERPMKPARFGPGRTSWHRVSAPGSTSLGLENRWRVPHPRPRDDAARSDRAGCAGWKTPRPAERRNDPSPAGRRRSTARRSPWPMRSQLETSLYRPDAQRASGRWVLLAMLDRPAGPRGIHRTPAAAPALHPGGLYRVSARHRAQAAPRQTDPDAAEVTVRLYHFRTVQKADRTGQASASLPLGSPHRASSKETVRPRDAHRLPLRMAWPVALGVRGASGAFPHRRMDPNRRPVLALSEGQALVRSSPFR